MGQGLLLALLVLLQPTKANSHPYLALALFSFSGSIFYGIFTHNQLDEIYTHFLWLGFPFQLLQGPALYLYTKQLLSRNTLSFSNVWHFLPFAFTLLWLLPFYLSSAEQKLAIHQFHSDLILYSKPVLLLVSILIYLQLSSYIVVTAKRIHAFHHSLNEYYSAVEKRKVQWLVFFLAGFASLWCVFLVLSALPLQFAGFKAVDLLPLVVISAQITLGIFGIRQQTLFFPADFALTPRPYANSNLKTGEVELIEQRLNTLMVEKKRYLEHDLSLSDLAASVKCSPSQLSQTINQQLNCNFNDYINQFRLEWAAKTLLEHPDKAILDIGLESGFGSKATFNSQFKKRFKSTPSQYRKSAIEQ
jgi:AraC-like DNA-binding protein